LPLALKKQAGPDPSLKAGVREGEIDSPPDEIDSPPDVTEIELVLYNVYTHGPTRTQYVKGVVYEMTPEETAELLALEENGVPVFAPYEEEVASPPEPEEIESPDGVTGGIGALVREEDKPKLPSRRPKLKKSPSIVG
jgi:hypothetical protein